MRIHFLMSIVGSVILLGCGMVFHEATPIYPMVYPDAGWNKVVDSLQPTLRWEPLPDMDVTDVTIGGNREGRELAKAFDNVDIKYHDCIVLYMEVGKICSLQPSRNRILSMVCP